MRQDRRPPQRAAEDDGQQHEAARGAPGQFHGEAQGALFDVPTCRLPEDMGYRGPTACAAAEHHLPPAGLLGPHRPGRAPVRPATGSGTQRLYGFRDILVLKVVKRLLDTGVSLQNIRTAVGHLRERGVEDLAT